MYRKSHILGFIVLVAALLLAVAAPRPVAAVGPTIKWVDAAAGNDANDGNSEATAYATLQQALDNSESGLDNANRSFIHVKDGTYSSAGFANTCEGIPGAAYVHNLDWLTIQAAPGHEPVIKPPAGVMSLVVESSDHLVVDNLDSDQTVALTDNWNVCDSDDLTLRNSTFEGGNDGIDFHTALTAALIENNTFTNIVNGSGDEVLDFTDEFSYSGVVIQDNDFINNYRQITLNPDPGGSANNFLIQRNWMNGTTSEEAIRLVNAGHIDIINNVILNSMQEGVYVDTGCSDIGIFHNTFFNNSQQASPQLGEIRTKITSATVTIQNNIINGNGANPPIDTTVASLPGEDYNLFYDYVLAGSFTTFGPNSISGQAPLFVSTTAGSEDLHLTFYSPAIESALPSPISDDKDKALRPNPTGTDPDMGAYEFAAGTITVTKETNPDGGMGFTFTLEPDTHPFVSKWGSYGANDGEFDHPMGMAVDGSDVYVVDHYNHRVQKFDSNGVYLTQWGSLGSGNGLFSYPAGLAMDGLGNVYVTDTNSLVQKFDSNGVFLTQWGGYGSGNGEFAYPYSVDVDEAGYVYVADTYNHRIQKFGPSTVVLDDDESHTFTRLPAGDYSVSEVTPLPAGWSLQSATCDNATTTAVETVAPSNITVADGDAWECTFTNVYTPPPANTCPVAAADSLWTDILGKGMGSLNKHKVQLKLTIPDYQDVDSLYGQMVAKAFGQANYVRFIMPGKGNYVQVNAITGPVDHAGGVFWYGAPLTPASPPAWVTGRWALQPTGVKNHIPRAFILYPTYDDPANSYVNVWDTYTPSEGEVDWNVGAGWVPYRELVVPIAAPLGATTFNVELALADNDKDARPVWVTVTAGGVTQTQQPTNPSHGDMLNLMTFTLNNVPAGTDEIVIEVYSPSVALDGIMGDSAAVVGMAANYKCEPITTIP